MDTRPDQAAGLAFYSCAIVLFLSAALASTFKPLHMRTTAAALDHPVAEPSQLSA